MILESSEFNPRAISEFNPCVQRSPDVLYLLVDHCDDMTLDESKCTISFRFKESSYFNTMVKPLFVHRFNHPYIIFINCFDELCLQVPLRSLFCHIFSSTPESNSSKLRTWINNNKNNHEKSQKTR